MPLTEQRKREIEEEERLKILRELQTEEQEMGAFRSPPLLITRLLRIPLQIMGEILFGVSIGFMSVILVLLGTIFV